MSVIKKGSFKIPPRQSEYLQDAIEIYRECLPLLTSKGKSISELINGKTCPKYIIVCHDSIKRIRDNIFTLTQIPINQDTITPSKLIIRSVISDLITLMYILLQDRKDMNIVCDILDLDSAKSLLIALEKRQKLGDLCEGEEYKVHLNGPISFLQTEISKLTAEIKRVGFKTKIPITEMAKFLLNHADVEVNFYHYLLFSFYKILSQSEHYSTINRFCSFYNQQEDFSFSEYARIIYGALNYIFGLIDEAIKPYVNN